MLTDLRTLADRHLALLRAELGAIAREALTLLLGAAVVASLLTGALILAMGALVIAAGDALYGSPLFGVALLVALLVSLAAWIPLVLLAVDRGRRPRRIAGLVALLATTLAAIAGGFLGLPSDTAAGIATLAGLTAFTLALLAGLRTVERDAIAARFYPHVSEAELRATLDAADALRTGRTPEHR